MNQSIISVRVDAEGKKRFEQFCKNVGMNVSTAINIFIKDVIREKELPFVVREDHFEEDVTEKLLEAEREMEINPKRYTLEEVMESMKDIIDKK